MYYSVSDQERHVRKRGILYKWLDRPNISTTCYTVPLILLSFLFSLSVSFLCATKELSSITALCINVDRCRVVQGRVVFGSCCPEEPTDTMLIECQGHCNLPAGVEVENLAEQHVNILNRSSSLICEGKNK